VISKKYLLFSLSTFLSGQANHCISFLLIQYHHKSHIVNAKKYFVDNLFVKNYFPTYRAKKWGICYTFCMAINIECTKTDIWGVAHWQKWLKCAEQREKEFHRGLTGRESKELHEAILAQEYVLQSEPGLQDHKGFFGFMKELFTS